MSRRVNPISLRLYNQKLWSSCYTTRLNKSSKILHRTNIIRIFLESKVNQIKTFRVRRLHSSR